MSEKQDNGGFAFPMGYHPTGNSADQCGGLTILDWFAGQVLAGMFAGKGYWCDSDEKMAEVAYKQASAMLAEKRKREAVK